jgi:chromosome segregation ATPase
VVLVALVVLTAALFLVTNNLGTKNDALKVQLVELKQTTEALRNELEGVNAKHSQLKEELSSTANTLGKKLGATQQAVDATKKTAQQLADEQAQQAQQTKAATQQLGQAIEGVRQESASKIGAVSSDVGGVKNDLGATKKDLDATKASLKSAMGDLGVQSGLIARNHDDVEALRKRNERNYFEFNIVKAKTSTKVGDIGIKLTKTDPKKGRYTLEIVADDKTVEKKDKTANEALQFYVARARGIPYEVVVNQVDKDRIVGYLATPK